MAKESDLLLTKTVSTMKKNNKKIQVDHITTLNGMMTFGIIDNRQHILDFVNTGYAEMDPFIADCKVQAMRDGNVYITEKPRRIRGKALFREDNASLTLGRDHRYYFVFTLPKELLPELPDRLVFQSLAIAQKVDRLLSASGEHAGMLSRAEKTCVRSTNEMIAGLGGKKASKQ